MAESDCIICSELLAVPGSSVTRCGHVFHTHCIERWFNQKPLCPLCKTAARPGSTRILRAPAALAPDEANRMRALSAQDPSGTAAAAAASRLRAASDRKSHDISVAAEACERERGQIGQKRHALHRLEAEVLKLRRELAAAERIEAAATVAAEASAVAGAAENEPPLPPPPPRLNTERSVSREAIVQQSKQLAWRTRFARHRIIAAPSRRLVAWVC